MELRLVSRVASASEKPSTTGPIRLLSGRIEALTTVATHKEAIGMFAGFEAVDGETWITPLSEIGNAVGGPNGEPSFDQFIDATLNYQDLEAAARAVGTTIAEQSGSTRIRSLRKC